ncbi:hypothetical protein MMC13_004508 [Lambiella insularis]|nr:hypothetical protein [Lambiella insularis]
MGMSILESNTYAIYRVCKTITRELWPVYQSLVVEIVCPEDATVFRDHIAELANRGFRKENVQRLSVGSSPRNTMYPSDASLTKLMRNVSQQFTGLQELKLEGEEPARRMVPRLRAALRQVIQRNTGLTHIAQVTIDVPGVVGDQLRADLRGWLRTG